MKTLEKRRSTKESIEIIFKYWNKHKIVQHRVLTDRIRRKINGQLKDYTLPEICRAISNYSTVLFGDEYYWTFSWTLYDFLMRGLEKFFSSASPFDNFRCNYPVTKKKPRVDNKEYTDRFEQWKEADAEKRIELEKEWGKV